MALGCIPPTRLSTRSCSSLSVVHRPRSASDYTLPTTSSHTLHILINAFTSPHTKTHSTCDNQSPIFSATRHISAPSCCTTLQPRQRFQSHCALFHSLTVAFTPRALPRQFGPFSPAHISCDTWPFRISRGNAIGPLSQNTVNSRSGFQQRRHRRGARRDEGGRRARRAW